MLYVNQIKYPDKPYLTHTDEPDNEFGKHSTVKTSGCGLCCAMMVVDRLLPGYSLSIDRAIEMAYEREASNGDGTKFARFTPALEAEFPLKCVRTMKLQDALDCLHNGGCVIALCTKPKDGSYVTTFTSGGHYVVVLSEEADGRLCILDPYLYEGKFDTPERKGRVEVKHGCFCYCRPEILEADVQASEVHYYLFTRTEAYQYPTPTREDVTLHD